MSGGLPKYSYAPLKHDEIRVAKILPGNDEHILLKVETVSLNNLPKYAAISYCWGEAKDYVECHCLQNDGTRSTLLISKSLNQALKQGRHQSEERTIWADQICINQKDKDEKSCQIRLMKQIFKSAYMVFTWLGEADNDTQLVFDLVRDIRNQIVTL